MGVSRRLTASLRLHRGVFIPTQIVNFALVPHHLRFVTIGVVSLFWSASLHCPILSLFWRTDDTDAYLTDAYLSSVNAKKQVEIAAEHEHAHTLEDSEKKDG